jgi:hypothetical protein
MSTETDALIRAYEAATSQVRERIVAYALAVWGAASAYRDADVDRIVRQLVPAVQAGQLQLATITDAYIGRMASLSGVPYVSSVDRSVVAYRGVAASEVYRRPAVTIYTALANGTAYNAALEEGTNRLLSIVSTDLQQARNRQASRSVQSSGFRFYRRVLSGKEDCDKCRIASTNRYRKADLMPIHPGCDCGVEPLVEFDPEPDPRADTVVTNMHGELGPTLGWAGEHFTSAADIPALH